MLKYNLKTKKKKKEFEFFCSNSLGDDAAPPAKRTRNKRRLRVRTLNQLSIAHCNLYLITLKNTSV